MWIVKLGGSLAHDERLAHWLSMLAELGGGRVLVVPGGAAFADAVRAAQARWGFDDLTAHNMAVLAMAQTAHLLHALEPRLVLVSEEQDILRAQHAGQAALWMPLTLLRDAPDMLTTWDVTSDSIALWLARRLNAERLVVVKACEVVRPHTFTQLAALGLVDRRFAQWASDAAFPIEVVECDDLGRVRDALLGGASLAPLGAPSVGAASGSGRRKAAGTRPRRKSVE
jgi:5-(aminomethyl)-3-furanmethanol phosphate kinase